MKAKLGQNFLADETVLQFEAEEAAPAGKSVLEIGAGDGRLTTKLLAAGAGHITAVELDPKLAKSLRMKFHKRVSVVEEDILEFDAQSRYNIVAGNIPYYITTPILLKLAGMNFDRAILCLQKEVALRMAAEPGTHNYGRLSVFSQLVFKLEVLALVPKEAFTPKPKVDSCVISLELTGAKLAQKHEKVIGAIFSHRKKSLKNAVVDARQELFGSSDKDAAHAVAQKLKYAERKVFTLTPAEALEVARKLC
ncbi:MAG: 16S rRNA (adenine(1518)-N(6)/adenine(1519)-N(6))-dimethyltransferase RsmA [Candidatus Micrarchaeia archaeon]